VSNTEPAELGEGHSPAAWTAVVIMLIGFAVGTICFWFSIAWGVWASAAVVLIGLVVGAVMGKAGYGVNGPKYVAKHHAE
jgi:ABC-type transport system involved in cytochrome c biogenesis permease subunit